MKDKKKFIYLRNNSIVEMSQAKNSEWESKVDDYIKGFIVANFENIDESIKKSNGNLNRIWTDLESFILREYQLDQTGTAVPNADFTEKVTYIKRRMDYFKDRELAYLQNATAKKFIILHHKMPEGSDWEKFVEESAVEFNEPKNYHDRF